MTTPALCLAVSEFIAFLSIARAEQKEQRALAIQRLSVLATVLVSALGSVSTGALSSAQARRLYHQPMPGMYEFVKVRRLWANVNELHRAFHSRKK